MDDDVEEILALPGGAYELAAHRTDGGYHAVWTCEECDDTGHREKHQGRRA